MEHRISILSLLLAFLAGTSTAQETLPGSRDPWQWPFDRSSIWNMPIGSNAQYKDANFEAAGHIGVDIQHVLELDGSDPLRQAYQTTGFGTGRCDGTTPHDIWLNIPDDWIVPDAGNSPYGGTPNSNFAFRLPETDTVFEGCLVSRCVAGGPFYLPDWMQWPANQDRQSIRGDGLQGGGQGASAMSALGGTLRLGELVGSDPIRHAIKVNPWAAKYCHYSAAIPGWKWPASQADGYASTGYNPDGDPDIVMGSLFAIPPDVTEESLNLQTEPGRKLFFTLQNYGAYFTEDAAWDVWDLIVERDAEVEFENACGFSMGGATWKDEMNKLMGAVHVVTNNTPSSIGGGGTPLQPLAPGFADQSVVSNDRIAKRHSSVEGMIGAREDAVVYDMRGRRISTTRVLSKCPTGVCIVDGGSQDLRATVYGLGDWRLIRERNSPGKADGW